MGRISSLFAHKVVNAATAGEPADSGRRAELLTSIGVDPAAPVDPKLMVPDTEYYALCERVTRATERGWTLPLRVGASMACDDYGAFGLAWKTAINLRGSYARADRYGRVLTSVSSHVLESRDGKHFMTLRRDGERRLGLRLSNEQSIVAVTQLCREVCRQPFNPEAVFFKHDASHDLTAHEDWFGCPVHYGADLDAIQVSDHLLELPNKLGDAGISRYLESHLDQEIAALPGDQTLVDRVRTCVSDALSEGVPTMSAVAGTVGMSSRTLQRRLADDGYTFQALVDAARRTLAERLLRATDYSLAEVAFLTGFSEQSAFNRAFKRWAGQTPRSFRLEAQSTAT
ncbi:MAG: AraC family transcriptional regulator ligand-binding domain-containing protein [Pseudomonadota bacterium]